MRVLIQAGHSSRFPPFAPQGGGAPGEAEWTADLAARVAARLTTVGVDALIVGHWYGHAAPLEARQRAALFISLHYDAAIYGLGHNRGCFADRAALDPVGEESDRAVALWQERYPAATGIPLREERRNVNTSYYYGFAATTNDTPGLILEHGCGAPVPVGDYPAGDDAALLHEQIERVAALDAEAILTFLEQETAVKPPAQGETMERDAEVARLHAALDEANAIKQTFEALLRDLEARRRLRRGTVDRLILEARGF